MSGPAPARRSALRVLQEIEQGGAYAQVALAREWQRSGVAGPDARLTSELVRGVLVWRRLLDEWIAGLSSVAPARLEVPVLIILRMSLYQLRFFDRVPSYAVVSDAVDLAREHRQKAAGFVNGVLRSALREQAWTRPLSDCATPGGAADGDAVGDDAGRGDAAGGKVARGKVAGGGAPRSVRLSCPDWLLAHLERTLGRQQACAALLAMNERPGRTVRVNVLRCTREELIRRLAAEGVAAQAAEAAPEGVLLPQGVNAVELRAYADGWFTLQGLSSMLIAPLLDARPGMDILDACAAPGGKATHLAELTQDAAAITAVDIHAHRAATVGEQARRLGHRSIRVVTGDSSRTEGEFDRVLLDAPCSGIGTIGRKPDLKWRVSEGGIRELAAVQRTLLLAAAGRVRPGGILVYAACTLSAAENEGQIAGLLAERGDFAPFPWDGAPWSDSAPGQARILPQDFGGDGFFVARLRRRT